MINGIIVVNKDAGFTSFDVVAKLRGILKQRKIGHTGTLDPDATGVLPVCIGSATKVCQYLTDSDKEYKACMLLGKTTDTQDVSGKIIEEKPVNVSEQQMKEVVHSFVGQREQIPPMYSALKVDGKKLCDLARKGVTVERKPRKIQLYAIEIDAIELPRVWINVSCSKGTYIRTLVHDIGEELGCGACLETLQRTKAAGFLLTQAYTLTQIEELVKQQKLEEVIHLVDSLFPEYDKISVIPEADKYLYNGNKLHLSQMKQEPVTEMIRVYDSNEIFSGVYQKIDEESYKPVKMFLDRN